VGECRGEEIFSMLQALNTGHPGSLTTIHSNSAKDTIDRVVNMVLMREDMSMPNDAILNLIFSAIDMIVYVVRDQSGLRRIDHIVELKNSVKASDGRTVDLELNLLWQYEDSTWEWKADEFLRAKAFAKAGWSLY
ncbi:MAG: Flp pilus assembly complex ATPase component TadA, partial [Syntrophomonadaceae bacterium]|nr:Flp pilus assembly complex ATPase component TadA [Syntrophomonadaceae bacterium]